MTPDMFGISFGGGSKSSSTTTNATTNNYDQRSIADAGEGIVGGMGNTIDRSTSSTINYQATDAGSIGQAFNLAQSSQAVAFDSTSNALGFANASSGQALGFARESFADLAGLAKTVVGQAAQQASAVVDNSAKATAAVASAYQASADTATGNKTLIYAGLAAVAVVAAIAFVRR
jgi:hypothetical protein